MRFTLIENAVAAAAATIGATWIVLVVFALFGLEPTLNTYLGLLAKPSVHFAWYVKLLITLGISYGLPVFKGYKAAYLLVAIWVGTFILKLFL